MNLILLISSSRAKALSRNAQSADVTLYGEGLPQTAWIESKRLVYRADCLIVGGTSLVVQPAASLAYDFPGKYLVVINRDKTAADRNAALVFHESISKVLDTIELGV